MHNESHPAADQRQTFTGLEAMEHPLIRAGIIVGYEVAKTTGERPKSSETLELANALLPAVDLIAQRSPGGLEAHQVEAVLVAAMVGALRAAAPRGVLPA